MLLRSNDALANMLGISEKALGMKYQMLGKNINKMSDEALKFCNWWYGANLPNTATL